MSVNILKRKRVNPTSTEDLLFTNNTTKNNSTNFGFTKGIATPSLRETRSRSSAKNLNSLFSYATPTRKISTWKSEKTCRSSTLSTNDDRQSPKRRKKILENSNESSTGSISPVHLVTPCMPLKVKQNSNVHLTTNSPLNDIKNSKQKVRRLSKHLSLTDSLRHSVRLKLKEQLRKSTLKGKQDYALPMKGELQYLQFLGAQPDNEQESDGSVARIITKEKIDHEIRMRDGTAKLLSASKNPQQMLEAAKKLLTYNSRISAYINAFQSQKSQEPNKTKNEGNQSPCTGKICITDIRVPLMWKDSDHFMNKGDHRRYAVFCMLKVGHEIQDTSIILSVDRRFTDISFEDTIIFSNVSYDFKCTVEVYCHEIRDDLTMASTPRKLKRRMSEISSNVSKSVGRKITGLKEDSSFLSDMLIGPKFQMISSSSLDLSDVHDNIQTFDLTDQNQLLTFNADSGLPLYGYLCCRLLAQPNCLITNAACGYLYTQRTGGRVWRKVWCVLKNLSLACWESETDIDVKPPCLSVPITKETQISDVSPSYIEMQSCFQINSVTSPEGLPMQTLFAALSPDDLKYWWEAFQQHMLDQAMWQHACELKTKFPLRSSLKPNGDYNKSSEDVFRDSDFPTSKSSHDLDIHDL